MAAARKAAGEPHDQPVPEDDEVAKAVQEATGKAQEQGFFGVETDPTPNSHYSVAGVVEGRPTPETDGKHAREVRLRLDDEARQR